MKIAFLADLQFCSFSVCGAEHCSQCRGTWSQGTEPGGQILLHWSCAGHTTQRNSKEKAAALRQEQGEQHQENPARDISEGSSTWGLDGVPRVWGAAGLLSVSWPHKHHLWTSSFTSLNAAACHWCEIKGTQQHSNLRNESCHVLADPYLPLLLPI